MEKWAIVYDGTQTRMYFDAEPGFLRKELFAMACQPLCGKQLKRPHLTCLVCNMRKTHYCKMQNGYPIRTLFICIRENRRFASIKDAIIKRLAEMLEFMAN